LKCEQCNVATRIHIILINNDIMRNSQFQTAYNYIALAKVNNYNSNSFLATLFSNMVIGAMKTEGVSVLVIV